MGSATHDRIADLFVKACDLEGEQRVAFLQTACAGDGQLLATVESLLAYDTPEPSPDLPQQETEPIPPAQVELRPGTVFADRFTIIHRADAGGMGVIYKAMDKTLQCEVALKLIRPSLAQLPSVLERFRREARMTHLITHPNICRVHDIGNAGGVLFLSMEWVEGETLAQLLPQSGALKEARAIEIAEKVAEALEATHGKRVIHRDLKPGNIMLDLHGDVRLMDFGLAHEQGTDSLAEFSGGTPMYMSPEQSRGRPLDVRTDLYSLGLVLHEMLTGQLPERGPTSLHQRLAHRVPPAVVPLLERLLAEDREERYPSATALRRDLQRLLAKDDVVPRRRRRRRRWAAVVAVVVSVLLVVAGWMSIERLIPPDPDPPPVNAGALAFYERGDRYLLNDSETLRSIDDAIRFFGDARQRDPDSALVQARLGEAYWMRYKQDDDPSSREMAEMAVSAAFAVDPSLPEVRNAVAMGLIVDGKYAQAENELKQALAARRDYALAWANLGRVYRKLGNREEGLKAYAHALEREPDSYRMHIYLGVFHNRFHEYDQAEAEFRTAIECKPSSWMAWADLGMVLLYRGETDEAIEALLRSIDNEDNADARSNLGTAYYGQERYEEAIEQYVRATELNPRRVVYWINLGETLVFLERMGEAREPYRHAVELTRDKVLLEPLSAQARVDLALYCAYAGDAACALENAQRAVDLEESSAEFRRVFAVVHAVLGNDDVCLEWLEEAVTLGVSRAQLDATPEFERLRGTARFETIVSRAG